jgi:hypothetical protein
VQWSAPWILAALSACAWLLLVLWTVAFQAVTDGNPRHKAMTERAEQYWRCQSMGSRRLCEQCAAALKLPHPSTLLAIADRPQV